MSECTLGSVGEPKIGLALASGGARGAAHVGVLKVLEREGIKPCAIAGSSIGAMVGGAYAAGASVERIEQEWLNTNLPKVVRSFLPTFPRAGLSSGGELRKYLRSMFGDLRIEDLKIPFAAVATDIDTGEAMVLREGPLVDALRASTAIPGIFFPVGWKGRFLVDGGLVEPLPVRICRELGAEIVIGVDITPRPRPTTAERRRTWKRLAQRLGEELKSRTWVPASLAGLLAEVAEERGEDERPLPGLYSVISQAVAIFQQEILRLKLTLWPADVLVRPELPPGVSYLRAAEGIRAGEEAMEAALPRLRALL
ncbi:MAG: Phospholipase, patatin family, putative [Acetothermia bacterium 64_32]|nr:MAG: Phospholipase, patatin family, putative [Acetothermia bacterium 64_32]HAF71031.1 patatin [Candidatus Acetothermia bacterium]